MSGDPQPVVLIRSLSFIFPKMLLYWRRRNKSVHINFKTNTRSLQRGCGTVFERKLKRYWRPYSGSNAFALPWLCEQLPSPCWALACVSVNGDENGAHSGEFSGLRRDSHQQQGWRHTQQITQYMLDAVIIASPRDLWRVLSSEC